MDMLFQDCAAFNQPIGEWKVDQVTNMHGMFMGAAAFNQPLGAWKVDQVTDRSQSPTCIVGSDTHRACAGGVCPLNEN